MGFVFQEINFLSGQSVGYIFFSRLIEHFGAVFFLSIVSYFCISVPLGYIEGERLMVRKNPDLYGAV